MGLAFAKTTKETWTYRYNTPNPTSGSDVVAHAAENWMMFMGINTGFVLASFIHDTSVLISVSCYSLNGTGTFTPMTLSEQQFAKELVAYWLSFVRSSNPNTFKLPQSPSWPAYDSTKQERIVLQEGIATSSGSYTEAEPSAESARCEFVRSKTEQQQD